jgi:hypothetical protein
MISSDVETIDVDNGEGDVESPKATMAPFAGTPRRVLFSTMVSFAVGSRFFLMCFGGWAVFLMCFRGWAVFSAVLWCFFLLLMALALPPLVFSAFLEVIRD